MKNLHLKSFVLAVSFFFFQPLFGAGRPLDAKEVQELKKFGSLEQGKGNLLTPARGAISPGAKAVRDLVQKIVLDIAGQDLSAKKINYVINVYGNNSMNAWVQQLNPTVENSAEGKWNKENPDKTWPLREAWGFKENKNSIYEIGVTTGLLRALNSQDELAFILGHELTHLFEGHADFAEDLNTRASQWWSSQAHEAVADHMGVDRILGKYELDAALSVMDKLHPKSKETPSPSDAFKRITSTHHAEGVRISALQFYIEYLRRYNSNANVRTERALPATVRLQVNGREEPNVPLQGDPESRDKYIGLVRSMLSGQFDDSQLFVHIPDGEYIDPLLPRLFGDTVHSYKTLLVDALNEIESAKVSKSEKINTFLKVMILLGARSSFRYPADWTENWFKDFDTVEIRRLMNFLVINASGEKAWDRMAFTQFIDGLSMKCLQYIQVPFLGNAKGQWMIERLSKVSTSWKEFLDYQTSMQVYERGNKFHTGDFANFLSFLNPEFVNIPDTPLSKNIRAKVLNELRTYPYSERLVQSLDERGLYDFTSTWDPRERKSPWIAARNDAVRPHAHLLKRILLDSLSRGLEDIVAKAQQQQDLTESDYYLAILNRLDLSQLNAAEMNQVLKGFERYIDVSQVPRRDPKGWGLISWNHFDLCAELLKRSQGNRERQIKVLKFIITFNGSSLTTLDEMSEKSQSVIRKALSSLNSEEKFAILEKLTPVELEFRKRIDELTKKFKTNSLMNIMTRVTDAGDSATRKEIISWRTTPFQRSDMNHNMLFLMGLFSVPQKATMNEFKRHLRNLELAKYYSRFSLIGGRSQPLPQKTASVLFQMMFENISSTKSLDEAAPLYLKTMKIIGKGFVAALSDQQSLQTFFKQRMSELPIKTQVRWLEKAEIRQLLGAQITGETLATYVVQTQKGSHRGHARQEADRLEKLIPLKDQWPDAYKIFRDTLSEKMNLQPHEIDTVFAKSALSVTKKAEEGRTLIRGMSGFSAYTRALPYSEQIEMVEFMMGRSNKMPKTLETQKVIANQIDIRAAMLTMREELKYRSLLDRSMVVNSILTGPNAMIQTAEGLKLVHDHLLKSVAPQNRDIAETLLNALAAAEGRNKSLLLSYALAQQQDNGSESAQSSNEKPMEGLTEALVLRSLLDAYGVPGVKLAQYLAFTSEFKDFQSALEVYQDAAMPISYYDALLLLQKRLGSSWDPALYKVIKIIGSGSVNIAIEYQNLKTGKSEVLSIARDQIEVKTKEDFRRFQLLIKELTRTPERKEKFEFIIGLLDLIQRSVELEFDKTNSFKMQKSVQSLYRRKVDGWNLQSVDAFEIMGMGIRMEKAPGSGARKILKNDPKTYESAMRAFMRAEYEVLRGVNEKRNWIPVPLHANPDVHDGQIMIDVPNRTVTILDFGQALEISNAERDLALDILRIISGAESVSSAQQLIQKHALTLQNKTVTLDKKDLALILKRGDRMDVFVHFLSLLNRSGIEVPLSTVHWVLAANRLIKLGEKIGVPAEASFRWMLTMKKVGLPLTAYNATKSMGDKARELVQKLNPDPNPAPILCSKVFLDR